MSEPIRPEHGPEIKNVDPGGLTPSVRSSAPLSDRQGLFIHTFQCMSCSLEFAIFSWWPDRHTVVNTACPECHRVTQKSHWMATVSNMPGQAFGQGPEIYQWSPVGPDPKLMADCSLFTGLPDDDPWEGVGPVDLSRLIGDDDPRGGT